MQQGYKKINIKKKDSVLDQNDLAVDIGTNITRARLIAGYTQVELAKKMDTTQPSLARYEKGAQMPSNHFLLRVAEALKTHVVAPTFESVVENRKEQIQFNNPSIVQVQVTHVVTSQTPFIAATPSRYAFDWSTNAQ